MPNTRISVNDSQFQYLLQSGDAASVEIRGRQKETGGEVAHGVLKSILRLPLAGFRAKSGGKISGSISPQHTANHRERSQVKDLLKLQERKNQAWQPLIPTNHATKSYFLRLSKVT